MNPNEVENSRLDWNRRDFFRGVSFGTLMMLMGGVPIEAQTDKPADGGLTDFHAYGPPVSCGLVGCGTWGKEILQTLALLPNAPVVAICDTYPAAMRKVKDAAPKAQTYDDYHKLIEQKDVQAVIVATPSHLHKEIVLAALAAGKHVYCEAPLASSIEDASVIAKAAKAAYKLNFQSGLQTRSDPQKHWLVKFIRGGAVGNSVKARSQWHKKNSWRRAAATPEREAALNWRLNSKTSGGLLGEVGIHQVDLMSWYLNGRPTAVTGFGGILSYNDGRDVPDTVQAVFELANGVNLDYECSLATSYENDYEVIYGTETTVMMNGNKAWMFKESDAAVVGWEVYARKDQFYSAQGIALVADASKQKAMLKTAASAEAAYAESPLHYALRAFVKNCDLIATGVENAAASGVDTADLPTYLTALTKTLDHLPAAGYLEGYEATVLALKANEAVNRKQRIVLQKEWFEI